MRRNLKLLAGTAGVLVVGVILWQVFGAGSGSPKTGGEAGGKPIPVITGDVTAHDVPLYLVGIGTVRAYNTVTIHTRVDGELMNVAFREGQDVKKGDLLEQIDPRPFQAALDNALANLAKDEATLANAKRDLTRYQDTASKGYSSRQQLDTQTATVGSLTASVQADRATVENAQVQLGYTTITSPLDGRTGIRLVDQGNIVHASDAAGLVVITQIQPISAIFTLPQDKLPAVAAAQTQGPLSVVAFSSDNSVELGRGTLELIDNQIDPTTGTMRLKARFPNPQGTLWPGQFVNIRLQLGDAHNGLTVDSRVIQRGPKGAFAYVIKPDNTVEMRQVEIGQQADGQSLVTSGLNAGERVVVDGQLRLQPGMKVVAADQNNRAQTSSGIAAEAAPDAQSRAVR